MRTLYILSTVGCGDFYVIAETPDAAIKAMNDKFKQGDYSTISKRETLNIRIVAREVDEFPEGKPFFSGGHNLIINP